MPKAKLNPDMRVTLDTYDQDHNQVKPTHKQELICYNGKSAYIDKKIALLILRLWTYKIKTVSSCEDNDGSGYVWIQFCSAFDAAMFLELCYEGCKEYIWTNDYVWGEHDKQTDDVGNVSIRFSNKRINAVTELAY